MLKQTSYTFNQAKKMLERYCSYQERCHKEVENKLFEMHLIKEVKEKILLHLLAHNFLNEERFAKSFSGGKFRIKKWGKQRIIKELKSRNISSYNIKTALKEINEDEYLTTFDNLALKRFEQLTEKNIYKKRKKLADYLLYRGWESDLVYKKTIELIN